MLLTLLAIVWVLIWVLALFDILRRHDLGTSSKVLWALAVFFVPVVGVLVYVIARPADATQYAPQDGYALQGDASHESARDRHPV
jgi:Phospholipase_D-nuclease N-terminal